jgi:hypothetical protein
MRRRVDALEALVRRLAHTSPHENRWEYSYRVMQEQARTLLASMQNRTQDLAEKPA